MSNTYFPLSPVANINPPIVFDRPPDCPFFIYDRSVTDLLTVHNNINNNNNTISDRISGTAGLPCHQGNHGLNKSITSNTGIINNINNNNNNNNNNRRRQINIAAFVRPNSSEAVSYIDNTTNTIRTSHNNNNNNNKLIKSVHTIQEPPPSPAQLFELELLHGILEDYNNINNKTCQRDISRKGVIHSLHAYNTAKDICQRVLGIVAEYRGIDLQRLYFEMDIEDGDAV